jgi:hypothetical protein
MTMMPKRQWKHELETFTDENPKHVDFKVCARQRKALIYAGGDGERHRY